MAESSQEASSFCCIPDIFLERRSAQSTPDSRHGRVQEGGGGEDEKEEPPIAEAGADDLVKEGFIPYNQLQLQHLPEAIQTQENLDRILSIGERVVCVNNNELSDERNMEEEMKMPGVALKGTGFINAVVPYFDTKAVRVVTNRHVLYNNDELKKSTIDIFFDSYRGENQEREMERTKRGSGSWAYRQNSTADLSQVFYDLGPNSKTGFDGIKLMREYLLYLPKKKTAIEHSIKSMGKGIVCVISHPLGRAKHVSFGNIVKCRPQSNTFLYDAPTKPGSSGAPIIVFGGWLLTVPKDSLLYHEGVDKRTKLKIGHAELNCLENLVPLQIVFDRENVSIPKVVQREVQYIDDLSIDEVRRQAQVDINYLRLGAFFPIFAAFIMHPEKYCSRLLTQRSARPCQILSKRDIELSTEDKRYMSWCLDSWVHELSSIFPPPTSDTAEPGADLSPFLTTEAPCWCQTIVEAVVHSSASDKDRNVFLRPDAVCGDFRLIKTWPWSLERSGVCSGPGREPMLKRCLLRECLDVFRGTTHEREVPLLLLVLIRRANDIVRQSTSQTPQVQHGCPGFTEATNLSSARSDVQQAEAPTRSMVSSSDQKQLKVVSDVFWFLKQVVPAMSTLSIWTHSLQIFYYRIFEPVHPGDDCVKRFRNALDLASHLHHHYFHDHPDSPQSQGVPTPGPQCKCGRPSWTDVTNASFTVQAISKMLLERKLAARGEEREPPEQMPPLDRPSFNQVPTARNVYSLLGKSLLECKSAYRAPFPLEHFLSGIDSLENFRNSCDLISVGLTSSEVFIFNSRNLLRQYRQDLFPIYISGPVSVFGRPGRWAGGDTPEEVKNTAWKLIRAACAESRFGHECLEVLEGDTARREKMIDLYVDMKQLKFSGDIEEEKMSLWYMLIVISNEMKRNEQLGLQEPFNFDPSYFVMKTFLKLAPWPRWDKTRQMKQRCTLS